MTTFPDEAEVWRIAGLTDGAARNALITNAYFELSTALSEQLPGNANWCTFATWASRQAGVTIRHEDLVDVLRERLRSDERMSGLLAEIHVQIAGVEIDLLDAVVTSVSGLGPFQRSGDAVARGNVKVYEEIGLQFSRFLSWFSDLTMDPDARIDEFAASLADGDPPDGQGLLRQAFRNYRTAARTPSAKERAEWVLLANLQIGFHEQIRLQPEIREAMDGAVIEPGDLIEPLLDRLGEGSRRGLLRWIRRLPPFQTPLRRLAKRLAPEVAAVARAVATEHISRITLPHEVLALGTDIKRQPSADLQSPANPELVAILARIAPAEGRPLGSGARDWSDLDERMRFIAGLFRAYQQDGTLFEAP